VTEIPVYSSVKTTLNRIRSKSLGNSLDPKLREDIIIIIPIVILNIYYLMTEKKIELQVYVQVKVDKLLLKEKLVLWMALLKALANNFIMFILFILDIIGSTNDEINVILS